MLLSIIIPCYNSERFVAKTVDMLISQDMTDCELILVNDGSTDQTLSILRHYERSYSFIRVIDQENAGVSAARNVGLNAAIGKYVYFLDSDDTLTDGTLDFFRQILASHSSCQMFAFGYETRRNGRKNKSYRYSQFSNQELSGSVLAQNFLIKKFCAHICSSIYERRFLLENQILFKEGVRIGEDVLFLLQGMFNAERIFYDDRLTFIYQLRNDSAMQGYRSYSRAQFNSHILFCDYLLPIASDYNVKECIHFFLAFSYLSNLRYYLLSNCKDESINHLFEIYSDVLSFPMSHENVLFYIAIKLLRMIPTRYFLLFKH